MITNTESLRHEYEITRLGRYRNIRSVFYPQTTFDSYFEEWSRASPGNRLPQWNRYCDVRDQVPLGTNDAIEAERRRRDHLN